MNHFFSLYLIGAILIAFLSESYGQTTINLANQCNCEVLNGTGIPAPGLPPALPGNLYIDNTTGIIYSFDGTSWTAASGSSANQLNDSDNDTRVEVEQAADEDVIRFTVKGVEQAAFDGKTLHLESNSNSVYIGKDAGSSSTVTGVGNVAAGFESMINTTTGSNNVALGASTLNLNVFGEQNVAVGSESLFANQGNNSTVVGYRSMYTTNLGANNTAVGRHSLLSNTAGSGNVALGVDALRSNSTAINNTAVGYASLYANSIGTQNVAVGYYSLYENNATNNTAVGHQALRFNSSGTTNSALGSSALSANTTGASNTAVGYSALSNNTIGARNTATGTSALGSNTTGQNNTAAGATALTSNTSGSGNTAMGYTALFHNTTGYQNVSLGFQSLYNNTTGHGNVTMGTYAMINNTTGTRNVAIGFGSLGGNSAGDFNTAVGSYSFEIGDSLFNSTTIGYRAVSGGNNSVRLGNNAVTSIGGYSAWSNVSDGRFKTNVRENVIGLDFITKLRPVTYQLDMDAIASHKKIPANQRQRDAEAEKGAEIQSGFIAQEVEATAQSIGYKFHGVDHPKESHGSYSLRYAEFVVPLVKAVQEQQETILDQKDTIDELQVNVKSMDKKMQELEAQLLKQAQLIEALLDKNSD